MAQWAHGNTKITLRDHGDFVATGPNGERITGPSLDAVKKKLDALNATAFEPFGILTFRPPYYAGYEHSEPSTGEVTQTKVVRFEKDRAGRYDKGFKFVLPSGTRGEYTETKVHPDTPANRKAIQAFLDLKHANNLQRQKFDKAEREAAGKILEIHAHDYAAGKKEPIKKADRE